MSLLVLLRSGGSQPPPAVVLEGTATDLDQATGALSVGYALAGTSVEQDLATAVLGLGIPMAGLATDADTCSASLTVTGSSGPGGARVAMWPRRCGAGKPIRRRRR